MSQIKSLSDNLVSSCSINDTNISPDLHKEYTKILNDIQHQLFFDPQLKYHHLEYILERRHTIEHGFVQMLIDRINQSNLDLSTRERLFAKINQLGTNIEYVDSSTNTKISFNANNDSDEETNNDYEPDYTDTEYDYCDDLENELLDQIEFEQDYNTY
ncbi:unnamed protein product [Adineta steineri]|uniref:Uncharacterized protein n=1 Tax=Adineta steineri TaxID=433720 RepID=A0A815MY44_9BILA|nr:unnamed protein product [Adineta steineri]CAF1621299.1 unnamed protein product [Adineta steineri]